ncbi:Polysaccharide deacetylase [Butyrivibrio fibrisolvens DSM 3071]|uniref:Polysaccharide deacetylase n=1 Tax=Butyrivibrio fibrisolvens DSM 3071 TaxID=1121131 RepID=A0A1M6CB05_BUTFI|nr:polysaccharide deacetylase family protein [Butyrivibrio fibrisolvens]SHI58189.1 Polysaccharide deacetylase [Butyrivibrio fibrisolvens DSM 3071]
MSSRVFVRRGRNNLRDERKGSWQGPVSDTHGVKGDDLDKVIKRVRLSDTKTRPFRFSDDSLHKTKSDLPSVLSETDRKTDSDIIDLNVDINTNNIDTNADSDNIDSTVNTNTGDTDRGGDECKTVAGQVEAADTDGGEENVSNEDKVRNEEIVSETDDPKTSTNYLKDINLDDLKVENASGEWVEYRSLRDRIASFDFFDKGFLIKTFVAAFLIVALIFFSLQCIILKSEYDAINDRLLAIQNEFNEYKDSLETLQDVQDNIIPLSGNAEAVSVVSKQSPASSNGIRYVYLTFDDGPSPRTAEILDILASYDVKATFFVCGKSGYDDMYKRIVDEGHTIGMHSYSHDYKVLYESLDSFQTDLHKIQNYIFDITGVWTTYYRFPGGSSNTASQVPMSDLIGYLDRNNITYFDWNVYGGDNIASSIIVSNVTANITEHENCMILLHDAADKEETVEALPEIIEYIQSLPNTVIVPVTEDTVPVQHSKNQ